MGFYRDFSFTVFLDTFGPHNIAFLKKEKQILLRVSKEKLQLMIYDKTYCLFCLNCLNIKSIKSRHFNINIYRDFMVLLPEASLKLHNMCQMSKVADKSRGSQQPE